MNWSEMSPRDRDALVAERVFGCNVKWNNVKRAGRVAFEPCCTDEYGCGGWAGGCDEGKHGLVKSYTTDISAAWKVVEKIRELAGWQLELLQSDSEPEKYMARFTLKRGDAFWEQLSAGQWVSCESWSVAPISEAICLAALRALGVEV